MVTGIISTVIIGLVVLGIIALAVRQIYKDRKAGKLSCGCKCANCPNSSLCHGKAKEKEY